MKGKRIDQAFFDQFDVLELAQNLLGCYLCTYQQGLLTKGLIVETEAYRGKDDKACHAYGYKRTKRTQTMFSKPGTAYVYLCYGIHHLFNIVAGPENEPDAVLIRAVEPAVGIETMLSRRKFSKLKPQLTAGPGVLSKALGISTSMNGLHLGHTDSDIWLEYGTKILNSNIIKGPRIGIDYAEECVDWPWRFSINNNPYLSRK
jgi:DNA-3-methyladenine glycosylase